MTHALPRGALTRFAVRLGLGASLTAVAVALPGGALPLAWVLGAGGLVALSSAGASLGARLSGGRRTRTRATRRRA